MVPSTHLVPENLECHLFSPAVSVINVFHTSARWPEPRRPLGGSSAPSYLGSERRQEDAAVRLEKIKIP